MQVESFQEWSRRTIEVGELTNDDHRLLNRLGGGEDGRLELRWQRNGRVEVKTKSWVGVIRLSNVAIHIRPKYAGNELGILRMLGYVGGYEPLKTAPGRRSLPADGADLLDLLCRLLAAECDALLRDGILHDYSTVEDGLPALRGSLRFREQATRRFGQLDVLECRFDEFHSDVLENQLLRVGAAVAAKVCTAPDLRRHLRRLNAVFSELAAVGPTAPAYYRERLVYGRRNERYRNAHELALVLLEGIGAQDLYASGRPETTAFLINMDSVFESFVTSVVAEAFGSSDWQVKAQSSEGSVVRNRGSGKRYSSIRPDIVMSDGRRRVPFDCKYKLYGSSGKKISSGDIYQTFVYAFAYGAGGGMPRVGIIYPAEAMETSPELEIRQINGPVAAELTGLGFNLLVMQQSLDDPERWQTTLEDVRSAVDRVLLEPSER